jgi:type VI secretion system secreted protein VgrG
MLITTHGRPRAQRHITDIAEAAQGLAQGHAQHDHLAGLARQAQAHDPGDQDDVVTSIQAQNDELQGPGGDPAQGRFPEFQAPHLALASPAGIQTQTPGSTHQASDAHHAITTGGHTSVSAGKSLLVSVKEAVRLFAYKAGMRLVSAGADIDIRALKQSVHILAKLDITHTAKRITLSAEEEVLITGGGSFTRWNAGSIVNGTTGVWQAKAASHHLDGPDNGTVPTLPEPPVFQELVQTSSLLFTLGSHGGSIGRDFADEPYELYKGGALIDKGVTDARGQLIVKDHQPGTPAYTVKLGNGAVLDLPVTEQLEIPNRRPNHGWRDHEDPTPGAQA